MRDHPPAANRTCWLTAGSMPLRTATVLSTGDKEAVVRLHEIWDVPAECELYFTFNCAVGRRCTVKEREGDIVTLRFTARIGRSIAEDNDNVIQV